MKNVHVVELMNVLYIYAMEWSLASGDGERGSNPRSRLKIYNWVAPSWLLYIYKGEILVVRMLMSPYIYIYMNSLACYISINIQILLICYR